MSDLVQRLKTDQPVELFLGNRKTGKGVKDSVALGYIHVKFTETRGGTNLGVRIDKDASDFTQADYENCSGNIKIVGSMTLDGVPVRCVAQIDLGTFQGTGHLEVTGNGASGAT